MNFREYIQENLSGFYTFEVSYKDENGNKVQRKEELGAMDKSHAKYILVNQLERSGYSSIKVKYLSDTSTDNRSAKHSLIGRFHDR